MYKFVSISQICTTTTYIADYEALHSPWVLPQTAELGDNCNRNGEVNHRAPDKKGY